MPIHHAIWRVGEQPVPLFSSRLASEQQLEDMIVRDPSILSSEWMLIGRQEVTSHSGRVDLLAIAPDASLVLIELKRDRTPREIIAQALDYASWVEQLTPTAWRRSSRGSPVVRAWMLRSRSASVWSSTKRCSISRTRSSSWPPSSTRRPNASSAI
ncbi:MAG: DUF91 domain-containing protein [Rhizobacter sp.]|nr:DUF91 domain-containing protein [Rhizobacter sp.]